jgi:Zn-dependent protease
MDFLYWVLFAIPSIIIASTVHEYAHAWSAFKLGDPTAKSEGRLTLNPIPHIDPIGAMLMVLVRFGWSKPVPINEYNFESPVIGTALTALAGPMSNLLLAIPSAILFRVLPDNLIIVQLFLYTFISVNLSLMVFNLLPFPPLDGHKIVRALLPKELRYYWEKLQEYSVWILLLLFMPFSPLNRVASNLILNTLDFLLSILIG